MQAENILPNMRLFFRFLFLLFPFGLFAQAGEFPMQTISLTDLSAFRPAKSNWRIAGGASADLNKDETLAATSGAGVLVNLPDAQNRDNLLFGFEHGDLDLELEAMLARHSNSGIYLQGRYEVQLLDSWGKKHPTFGDIGGVYERWDDNKPEGQKGFQGIPPKLNAARAPGLWQRLRIEFQAPRFDASGKKTANARLIRVTLNDVVIQENVELTGPTRGPAGRGEVAMGAIMIQGDHGPVAFRNIRYRAYGGSPVQIAGLKYRYFAGEHDLLPDFSKLKADAAGAAEGLTWEHAKGDNDFALNFTGNLLVPESGKYAFNLTSNGNSLLIINGDTVIGQAWWTRSGSAILPAGSVPFELSYCKNVSWVEPALALFVEGANFRPHPLHLPSAFTASRPTNPILLQPGRETEVFRSFIDIPQGGKTKRIVHALSVGFPDDLSYSYDLDNGGLVQVWKGGFLDCTPMWNDRGDGHADPLGSVLLFGNAPQTGQAGNTWPDTLATSANYRFKGFHLDAKGYPAFHYSVHGLEVTDRFSPQEDGKWLARELNFKGNSSGLQFRLAAGKKIVPVSADTWAVDDYKFYIQLPAGIKPEIRQTAGGQEMVLPVLENIQYYIIW